MNGLLDSVGLSEVGREENGTVVRNKWIKGVNVIKDVIRGLSDNQIKCGQRTMDNGQRTTFFIIETWI